MYKQKQIEELTKELDYCETHDCIGESCAKCRAIWLIENGYRKIPEGSVVLTEDDVWQFNVDCAKVKFLKHLIKKEAVKEVLEKLKGLVVEYRGIGCGVHPLLFDLFKIAKDYGVKL